MRISRRGVLAGAALGGGLIVAWTLMPRNFAQPLEAAEGEYAFDAWLKIAEDGVITVAVPQLEMGQGVTTILPQIVVTELGADWRQIAVEPAPVSGAYANIPLAAKWAPLWMPFAADIADQPEDLLAERFAQEARFAVTAGGTTLEAYEQPCRAAAASARAMLAMAAAERWDIAWEECGADAGFVVHGEKRLRFGELAAEASAFEPPDPPPLRSEFAAEEPLAGPADAETAFPRLDLPSKSDGSFLFAGDVRLPDMAYAAIRHAPIGRVTGMRFDAEKAKGVDRLLAVVNGAEWLAAVASDCWAAETALSQIAPVFTVDAPADSEVIEARLDSALRNDSSYPIATRGEGKAAMGKADLALRYDIAPALHVPVETATVTARLTDGRLELWMAAQAPEYARQAAADALGISYSDTVLYPMAAGGSFDARLDHHHAIEASLIAREAERPIQLVYSRWQEIVRTIPRPPAAAHAVAKLDAAGQVNALKLRFAMPAASGEFGARLFDNATRHSAIAASEGESERLMLGDAMPPYGIEHVAVDHVPVELSLPSGPMRGSGSAMTTFVLESFIDEVARRNNREPLSYRISMLGKDLRMVECLQRAARLGEWDGGEGQSGKGLACCRMGDDESGGRIACVATARRGDGGVRVEKISAVADIGRIVNLDIARQQIEGGLVFGLSLAIGSSTEYLGGLPLRGRLAELGLPLLVDCPEIEVDFVASEEAPFDPGELGVAVVAPALANALYSSTGLRLRRLPLLSEGL